MATTVTLAAPAGAAIVYEAGEWHLRADSGRLPVSRFLVTVLRQAGGISASGTVAVPAQFVNELLAHGFGYPDASPARVAANVPDSEEEAYPTVAEFNALLKALKDAGLMEPDA